MPLWGKLNGMAAQLKRDIPHLVQQHCIAHQEDLKISDAWKEVKLIRDIETLMRTVYTVFCQSSRRKCKFQEIVDASEYKDTDPVSKYCHKKLNTMEYQITLEVLNDVLWELASVATLLRKRSLTPLEAFHLARGKLSKIRRQYLGDSVLWSDKVKALLDMSSQENNEIDTSSIITFINILCAHLAGRFPEDEVQEWSAFDCAAIVKCDFNFGIHQVSSLCSKYKDFLAEEIVIVSQNNDFKFAVAERIKSQFVLSFPDMVTFAHQNKQFQDLAKLMDIGGTFLASSADCERGFSLMNTLKNKLRNCLQVDHLVMLMCIKSYQLDGGLTDLDRVYIEWAN
ncbi:unnamed protein product [Caretta caretta]